MNMGKGRCVLLITGLLIFSLVIAGCSENTESSVAQSPKEQIDVTEPVQLLVHSAETTYSLGGIVPKQGRIFLIVDISIENCAVEPALDFDEQQLTVNDYGHSDGITFKAGTWLERPFNPCEVPVGELRQGQVIFGVPENDDLYAIRFREENGVVITSADISKFFGGISSPSPEPSQSSTPVSTATPSPSQSAYNQLHDDMAAINTDLADEINKLPEIRDGISEDDLEAVEDIVVLYKNGDTATQNAYDQMLDEGVRDGRSYCTPLQALLWIGYDREFTRDNPLESYSLDSLLAEAWEDTSVSGNYQSDKWDEFDEVVERLNSPHLVSKYGVDNIVYDFETQERILAGETFPPPPPSWVFSEGKGNCNERARFALYCLISNGYSYNDFNNNKHAACCIRAYESDELRGVGHCTCLFQDGTEDFYIIDIGRSQYIDIVEPFGPYYSMEEVADATYSGWKIYTLFDLNGQNVYKYIS